ILMQSTNENSGYRFVQDQEHFNASLKQLLKPRFPGSFGHAQVIVFLAEELEELGFRVTRDQFYQGTFFTNVIGIWGKEAKQFLVLTCHFDSQSPMVGENNTYLGATDAAVSCAIILNVAKTLGRYLKNNRSPQIDVGLALVFFDGHKPLPNDRQDSLSYIGSQHFVDKETIALDKIALLVHLNAIGAANQTYFAAFEYTSQYHDDLADIELDLRESGQLIGTRTLFQKLIHPLYGIAGDHVPFYKKGKEAKGMFKESFKNKFFDRADVQVLNVAPDEYPEVRNTPEDNAENLHWPTIWNVIKIMQRFVYQILENTEF
ncbi:hypothetical protein KR018_010542, partial [Drosophila ironensis]